MRVGFVAGEYPPMQGGVGAYTRILAQTMVDQGHDVFILASPQAREADSRIHLSPFVQRWNFACIDTVRRWANEQRLDVVNLQYQTAAFGMSPWIHFIPDRVRAVPVITTFHDLRFPYLFPKAGRLRSWIVNHLANTSDGVIATNHEDMRRLTHHLCGTLIPIGSNILQPLPADFDPQPWREKAGAHKGDVLLAFFGLVNRSKGLEVLLDSLAALRAQNIPARLVIIGGGAGSSDPSNITYQQAIKAQIENLSLTQFVHLTGFVSDAEVGQYLTASDLVVLPFRDGASYRRGSLMAALHYGCAIVTTQPQVDIQPFADGDNMLLVPRDDTEALTGAIARLHQSPALRSRLREGARQLTRQFEWSQIARDTLTFYQRVSGACA